MRQKYEPTFYKISSSIEFSFFLLQPIEHLNSLNLIKESCIAMQTPKNYPFNIVQSSTKYTLDLLKAFFSNQNF